jgi:ABC-type proline/glycine betaine transport system permease subunit
VARHRRSAGHLPDFHGGLLPIVLATTAAVANIPSVYFRVARDLGITGRACWAR